MEVILSLFLLLQAALYSSVILLAFFKQRQSKSEHDVELDIAALNLPAGVARLKAIREDSEVFEKAKRAARLKVQSQGHEPRAFEDILLLAGLSDDRIRRLFGIRISFLLMLTGIGFGLTALRSQPRSLELFLSGLNLGLFAAAAGSGVYLWHVVRSTRREIGTTLPAFAQQMITVLVAGYDVESGLRKLLEIYHLRESRNFLVNLLDKVAVGARESGSLLRALRTEAGRTGNPGVRQLLASLDRGSEHGASIVKQLQDQAAALSRVKSTPYLYARQPLKNFLFFAGLPMTPALYRVLQGILCLIGAGGGIVLHFHPMSILALSLAFASIPYFFGIRRIRSRGAAFEGDFPFFIGQLTSLLSSGKETLSALRMAMGYLAEDSLLRSELENLLTALSEHQEEITTLSSFAKSIPSAAADQMAIALALSRMVPGKLYHMLTQAVVTIQKRT